uniref:Prolactin regulatory element-binding protein-like n=1 Tax=Hirondellea gigas TaxID=1518452 RepID=A0A2P2I0B2_9CRUS
MAPQYKPDLVSKTEFPPYALACVADRYVIVAGGGGSAKTGIKNKFEVYQLYHTGKQMTSRCVLSYDVGEHCISNMTAWTDFMPTNEAHGTGGYTTPCPTINLAVGKEESCVILKLTPKLITDKDNEQKIPVVKQEDASDGGVRKRGTQQQTSSSSAPVHQQPVAAGVAIAANDAYYTFNVSHVSSITTTFSRNNTADDSSKRRKATEDVYQKVCRVSRDHKRLVTAGTDGAIRVWQLQQQQPPSLLLTIQAHTKEVDQIDLSPDAKQITSVCKGMRECCVWDAGNGKRLHHLALDTQGVKYKFAWARYGCVEGQLNNSRLFSISNPVMGSKNPGIVAKWCGKAYTLEKRQSVDGVLSNLAVTDDGRYLATGSMDGDIVIMVAYSLQVLQRVKSAHSMFVTGVEWMADGSRSSCIVRGFSDASLLSMSCDNTVKVTHVPAVTALPVWLVAVLATAVLAITFIVASYFGL